MSSCASQRGSVAATRSASPFCLPSTKAATPAQAVAIDLRVQRYAHFYVPNTFDRVMLVRDRDNNNNDHDIFIHNSFFIVRVADEKTYGNDPSSMRTTASI